MRKKRIENYPDYDIYDDGRVYSHKRNKFLKPCKNDQNYDTVNLYNGSIATRRSVSVHVLVAENFVPNPNNYPEVNHKDFDKSNNDYRNLEWCDQSYNNQYNYEHDHHKKQRAVYCYETDTVYRSLTEAERKLNCDHRMISACCSGKRHKHKGMHFRYED